MGWAWTLATDFSYLLFSFFCLFSSCVRLAQFYSLANQSPIQHRPLLGIKTGQISIDFISLDLSSESQQSIVFETMKVYIFLVLLAVALFGMAEAQRHHHRNGDGCISSTDSSITQNRAISNDDDDDDDDFRRRGRRPQNRGRRNRDD